MPPVLEQLAAGVRRFQQEVYEQRRDLYRGLASAQEPKALFLTCADSRIVPAEITQSSAGELFVERNPGNLVPVFSNKAVGVSASIEYAVEALRVPCIIVCGHSDCGAMKAVLHPEKGESLPAVSRWLTYAADASMGGEDGNLRRITEANVVLQLDHLLTHPSVGCAIREERLTIHGWVFDIETGGIDSYDWETRRFLPWPW